MNAATHPVIAATAEAMDYYLQRACLSVEQVFSNAPPQCYGTLVAGYLMAAATIHAGNVQAVPMADTAGALHAGFDVLSEAIELVADGLGECEAAMENVCGELDKVANAADADNRHLVESIRGIEEALRTHGKPDGSKPRP